MLISFISSQIIPVVRPYDMITVCIIVGLSKLMSQLLNFSMILQNQFTTDLLVATLIKINLTTSETCIFFLANFLLPCFILFMLLHYRSILCKSCCLLLTLSIFIFSLGRNLERIWRNSFGKCLWTLHWSVGQVRRNFPFPLLSFPSVDVTFEHIT